MNCFLLFFPRSSLIYYSQEAHCFPFSFSFFFLNSPPQTDVTESLSQSNGTILWSGFCYPVVTWVIGNSCVTWAIGDSCVTRIIGDSQEFNTYFDVKEITPVSKSICSLNVFAWRNAAFLCLFVCLTVSPYTNRCYFCITAKSSLCNVLLIHQHVSIWEFRDALEFCDV